MFIVSCHSLRRQAFHATFECGSSSQLNFFIWHVKRASLFRAYPRLLGEPSDPVTETHFGHLWSQSFGRYPNLMTLGEGWKVDQLLHLEAQLPLCQNSPHYCWWAINPLVNITYHLTLTREQDPKMLRTPSLGTVTCSQQSTMASHSPLPLQTAPVHTGGHGLIKPAVPHHLQKGDMQSWGCHTGILHTLKITNRIGVAHNDMTTLYAGK